MNVEAIEMEAGEMRSLKERRLQEHQGGRARATRPCNPNKLHSPRSCAPARRHRLSKSSPYRASAAYNRFAEPIEDSIVAVSAAMLAIDSLENTQQITIGRPAASRHSP